MIALVYIVVTAMCSPEIIDHDIHPIPMDHEGRVRPDEDHYDREDRKIGNRVTRRSRPMSIHLLMRSTVTLSSSTNRLRLPTT